MIPSLLEQALIILPLLIGAYITLSLLKLPDFSIESSYLFGAVIAYIGNDFSFSFMVFSSFVGGAFVGIIVSFLNQYLKLPFLLAAIITNGLFHGLVQHLLGTSIKSFHHSLPLSESLVFASIAFCLIAVIGFILRSQLGYSFAIYGNNPLFFFHHPVSGRYCLFFGVMIGHGCAGIGGFLFALSNGFVDLTMNFGIVLLCLTTLILGKTFIRTDRPNILVPLTGLIAYFCVQQTLLCMGLNLKYFNSFQAIFIIVVLSVFHKKKFTLDHLGV